MYATSLPAAASDPGLSASLRLSDTCAGTLFDAGGAVYA